MIDAVDVAPYLVAPSWPAPVAVRLLLRIYPGSIDPNDRLDDSEVEGDARALINWLWVCGLLPKDVLSEADGNRHQPVQEYLLESSDVRASPRAWLDAAAKNPAAPLDWIDDLRRALPAHDDGAVEVAKSETADGSPLSEGDSPIFHFDHEPATAKQIEEAFPIQWGDKLKKAPSGKYQWLEGTWIRKGQRKPGHAAAYNPALIAVALVTNNRLGKNECAKAISRNFPKWVQEWEQRVEFLNL